MKSQEIDKKVQYILDQETHSARQLALHVIEKPIPHVWMIFIPIFFVFYFWKLKQYESGLKNFADNHLLQRQKTLAAVAFAEKNDQNVDILSLMAGMNEMQPETRDLYAQWLSVLAAHFQLLLASSGYNYSDLVRAGYRDKLGYQQFCERISEAETTFSNALLPTLEGDNSDLYRVTEAIHEGLEKLRQQEIQNIFPAKKL